MLNKLSILLLVVVGFLIIRHHHAAKPTLIAKAKSVISVPAVIKEGPFDHRSQEEWQTDCRPVYAHKLGTSIYSYWCTRLVSKFDADSQLPRDTWERVQ